MAETKNKEATVYHVTPKGLGWQVKGVGNSRPTKKLLKLKKKLLN